MFRNPTVVGLSFLICNFLCYSSSLVAINQALRMTSKVQPGWAVRRKHQCKSTENSRPTWADWVVCCPSQTKWAPIGNTTQCVIEDTKEEVPTQCADPTLVLWKNRDYFCCEPGLIGFENYWKSVGCADVDEVSAGIENRTMKNVEQLGIIPSMISFPISGSI